MVNKFCLGSIDFKGCEVERYNVEEINILQIFKKAYFVEHLKRLLFSQPKSSNYLLERKRERKREKERETDRQTDRQADRQTDRQTDRQIETERGRETERETEEEGERDPSISNFTIRVVSSSYLNLEIFTSVLVLVLHKLCLRHDFPWLAKNIMISCKDYDIMQ